MKEQQNTRAAGIHQTLIILWASLTISHLLFLLVIYFSKPELFTLEHGPTETPLLPVIAIFAVAAIVAVGISFVIRSRSSKMSEIKQSPVILQTGLISSLALCEAASLFGLVTAFAFSYSYFYFWIFFGVVASVLHFPKFSEVLAATYKSGIGNGNGS